VSISLIEWLLKRLLPGVLVCAALGGGGWWLHHTGYGTGYAAAKAAGDTALTNEKQARADERQQLAQASQQALIALHGQEQALRERADALSGQLTDTENTLQQTRVLLSQDVDKAVSNDNKNSGCGFTGLGPGGLQLYSRALGYPGGGDARTGHTAGQ
jgi:hypothetical protein